MKIVFPALIAFAALSACSGASSETETQADRLENAASQSTPEAAEVMQDQADAIRANGAAGEVGTPGGSVQQAMEQAGAAQANAQPPAPGPKPTPQSKQALPHGNEKGAPPATVDTK